MKIIYKITFIVQFKYKIIRKGFKNQSAPSEFQQHEGKKRDNTLVFKPIDVFLFVFLEMN